MIRTDAAWLRRLADLVETGEIEVGRVEPKDCGVLLGTFKPGTFAAREEPTGDERFRRAVRDRAAGLPLPKIR
jgi:hypothetical protein